MGYPFSRREYSWLTRFCVRSTANWSPVMDKWFPWSANLTGSNFSISLMFLSCVPNRRLRRSLFEKLIFFTVVQSGFCLKYIYILLKYIWYCAASNLYYIKVIIIKWKCQKLWIMDKWRINWKKKTHNKNKAYFKKH